MHTWLITGSSRGIGLGIVRRLLVDETNIVIATCRNPEGAEALKALANDAKGTLYIVKLDVASPESIRASVGVVSELLGDQGLDYLINNAGIAIAGDSGFDCYDNLMRSFEVNTAAPALIGQVYLPLVEKSARRVIVNLTSGLASFGKDLGPRAASYTISKVALNMLTYKQAKTRPDIIALILNPGLVKTDLAGARGVLEVGESVGSFLKFIATATTAHSGKMWKYDGSEIVW